MATHYSQTLADMLAAVIARRGLTNAAISQATGGRVSEGYISRIRSTGYVPSEKVLLALSEAYPEDLPYEDLMRAARGMVLPVVSKNLETFQGTQALAECIQDVVDRIPDTDEASRLAEVAVRAYLLGKQHAKPR